MCKSLYHCMSFQLCLYLVPFQHQIMALPWNLGNGPFRIPLVIEKWLWSIINKCIEDDTKTAACQSLNCIKNNNKIKYGEKLFSIWQMEFLQPAVWHDHDIDFIRSLHPAMWHVALESWQWIHQVAAPCNVIRGSGMTCHWICPNVRHIGILHLVSISTHHQSRHVILYQSAKFYPNWTTLGRKKWCHVDFQDGGCTSFFVSNMTRLFGNFATADFRQIRPRDVNRGWNTEFRQKFIKSFHSGVICPKIPKLWGGQTGTSLRAGYRSRDTLQRDTFYSTL